MIARLMTSARDHMSKADTVTIAAIEAGVPTLVAPRALTDRFHTMIRNRKEADLVPWIAAASGSLIGSLLRGSPKTSLARLKALGFDPVAKLVRGEPAKEIGTCAKQIEADLIVVGHRRQSAFDRWWSGPKGAYLMDYTDCSLLVARNVVSDEAMKAAVPTSGQTRD